MTTTPGLELTEHANAGINGYVTANAAYRVLEVFSSVEVLDMGTTAPPGSPADGALYILGGSPTGLWSGQGGKLALFINSAWVFVPPKSGMQLMVAAAATHDFAGIMVAYSVTESLWFPVQPFATTGTAYWTGRYFPDGTKIWSEMFTGPVASGGGVQNFAHSRAPVFSHGIWVEGYLYDDTGERASSVPGRIPSAQIALEVDSTQIILTPTTSLGPNYKYAFTLFYSE